MPCLRPIFLSPDSAHERGLSIYGRRQRGAECRNGKGRRKRDPGTPIVAYGKRHGFRDVIRWRASAVLTALQTFQCRFFGQPLRQTFVDLGLSPLCETYISAAHLKDPELLYPLHSFVCEKSFLVQLPEYVTAREIFASAYFSSYSDSWLAHVEAYVSAISKRLNLNDHSFVVEVARTMVICCNISGPWAFRCWASSRQKTWPRLRLRKVSRV